MTADEQETEQTLTGYKVPVLKRDEFLGNLNKAASPDAVDTAALLRSLSFTAAAHSATGAFGR
jgi:hypothetical protein